MKKTQKMQNTSSSDEENEKDVKPQTFMDMDKYIVQKQINETRNSYNKKPRKPAKDKSRWQQSYKYDILKDTTNLVKDCGNWKSKDDMMSCTFTESDKHKHFLQTLKKNYSKRINYSYKKDVSLLECYMETDESDNFLDIDLCNEFEVLHGNKEETVKLRELQKAISRWNNMPVFNSSKVFPDNPHLYHETPMDSFYGLQCYF